MKKIFILGALLFITSIPMVSCTDDDDKDPNFMPRFQARSSCAVV